MRGVLSLTKTADTGKGLYFLSVDELAAWPDRLGLPSANFQLFLACDATYVAAEQIACFADKVLRQGAAYVCVWGPNSGRIDTAVEQAESLRNLNAAPGHPIVTTTWHGREPLEDALWFFLNCAVPDEPFRERCTSWLAASVGSRRWSQEIWRWLERQAGKHG